jgi:hypothetical protein
MRIKEYNGAVSVWISATETNQWARRWPCSELGGSRVFAAFARNGDLMDLAVDGKQWDGDANEFSALCADFIARKFPNHPAAERAEVES